MKLTVIGGGGVRSMFLAKSLAQKAEKLGISELCFMDNNALKLNIYGEMAKKVASILAPQVTFTLTLDAIEAVKDADYIITTIRVGEDEMRVKDERIALEHGVIGQETTGVAGFSFAMRSIPTLIEYCELIKKYSTPSVKVFNFTNPAGIVSEALRLKGYDFTFGVCDAPSGMMNVFKDLYAGKEISGEIVGLNHLSFFSSITLDGKEILPTLINDDKAYKETDLRYFEKGKLIKKQYIPNEYLYYYFYPDKALENILNATETRGELIERVNREMTTELGQIDVKENFEEALRIFEKWYGVREGSYMATETGLRRNKTWHFDMFSQSDDGYAGVALKYIEIINSGKEEDMVLVVPNGKTLSFLEESDVIEATVSVSSKGVVPHTFKPFEEEEISLISKVKEYERVGAKAIIERDVSLALKALEVHPLMNVEGAENSILEAYIEHNKEYLQGWK